MSDMSHYLPLPCRPLLSLPGWGQSALKPHLPHKMAARVGVGVAVGVGAH